jgi:hypothetical protein
MLVTQSQAQQKALCLGDREKHQNGLFPEELLLLSRKKWKWSFLFWYTFFGLFFIHRRNAVVQWRDLPLSVLLDESAKLCALRKELCSERQRLLRERQQLLEDQRAIVEQARIVMELARQYMYFNRGGERG